MTPPVRIEGASAEERLRYGSMIKSARTTKGMLQAELAEAAGVSRKTISNIENGMHAAQPDILRRVFSAVGIQTEDDVPDEELRSYAAMFMTLMQNVPADDRLEAMNRTTAVLTSYFASNVIDVADRFTKSASFPEELGFVAGNDESGDELTDPNA